MTRSIISSIGLIIPILTEALWFVTRSKKADKKRGYRDRQGQTLFIDARKMGQLEDRVHRYLTDDEIDQIASVYHGWRNAGGEYEDKPG